MRRAGCECINLRCVQTAGHSTPHADGLCVADAALVPAAPFASPALTDLVPFVSEPRHIGVSGQNMVEHAAVESAGQPTSLTDRSRPGILKRVTPSSIYSGISHSRKSGDALRSGWPKSCSLVVKSHFARQMRWQLPPRLALPTKWWLAGLVDRMRDLEIAARMTPQRPAGDAAALDGLEHEGFEGDAGLLADFLKLGRTPAIGNDHNVRAEIPVKPDVAHIEVPGRDADVNVERGKALAHRA